jgi:dTDP-4-amino-4,6-dideoxygalactose transaminase
MSSNNLPGVPFLDLVTPHADLREELSEVFHACLDTAGFIGGPMVQGFEEEFARYCDARFCVGVNSGTDALRFALMASGVGNGDSVITVPNTFIATTEAISQTGAQPVFVDIDEATYNMDVAKLREYLESSCKFDNAVGTTFEIRSGRRVAAVIPVHLYGQMADMDAIVDLAERFNLVVIEDACQAHGAEYFSKKHDKWLKAGSIGRAAAFSFYPGKNLGACGEAGAVTTNDENLAAQMRMIRDHGQSRKYHHQIEGYNGRLDAMQAGFLKVKLACLPEWTRQRQEAAARYGELFGATGDLPLTLPVTADNCKAVFHLYVVRVDDRDQLMKDLGAAGIGTGIHYPIPLHLQEAYGWMEYNAGDFPVAEKVSREIVSLPMFPQLTLEQQQRVVQAVVASRQVAGGNCRK